MLSSINPVQKEKILTKNELLIYLTFFFYSISVSIYIPYAPVWLAQIFSEESYFVLGLVNVLPSIVLAISTPFWGKLADRYGVKPFVLLGLSAAAIMYASLLLFARTSVSFLIIILIGNIFIGAEYSNVYSLATLSINKRKEMVLSRITMTMSLSWLIASPIAGFIRDSVKQMSLEKKEAITSFFLKFSSPLVAKNIDMIFQLFIAIFSALVSLSMLIFVKANKAHPAAEQTKKLSFRDITGLTAEPYIFVGLIIFAFTFQACSTGFWNYHSIYFLSILNMTGRLYSVFLVITTVLGIIFALLLSKVKKPTINMLIVVGAMQIQVLIFLFFRIFPYNTIMVLLLYSIPLYPIFLVPLYSLVTEYSAPEFRSTAYGFYNTAALIGGVIATLGMGALADFYEDFLVILTSSLILAIASSIESIVIYLLITSQKLNPDKTK